MASQTYTLYTDPELIIRLDRHAERMRRSRNFLINEAIERLLETLDAEQLKPAKKAGKK